MKLEWFAYLSTLGITCILTTQPTTAEVKQKPYEVGTVSGVTWQNSVSEVENWVSGVEAIATTAGKVERKLPIKDIPHLSDFKRPYTNVQWLTQSSSTESVVAVQVTGVRLSQSPTGIKVILENRFGRQLQVLTSSSSNTLIADIPNSQLRLPQGNEFRVNSPAAGIAAITVSNLNANTIQVRVTGTAGVPKVEVFENEEEGLTLSLKPAQKPDAVPSPPPQTPKTPIEGEEEEETEIVVTGEREGSYLVEESTTGTKIPLPQRDVPQSVQVIPRQVIEDRQVVRLSELADNVSGVQPERGYGGISSLGFRIRGFLTNFETLRNGFPDYGYFSPRDVANIERLEILKGPAAVLYGGSPTQYAGGSGLVNTFTKQPLETPLYNVNMTIGSYAFYRPTLDFGGPLTTDRSLLYRLNIAYENANSFRDFNENESFFISPVLTWRISDRTKLTFEFEHQDYHFNFDQGFPREPEALRLPRERFLGEPDLTNGDVTFNSFSYNFEHQFSDRWRFRQGFNILKASLSDAEQFYPIALQDDRRTLDRDFYFSNEFHKNITLQNELTSKFSTGSVPHTLLLGVDIGRNEFNYLFDETLQGAIDIFDPQYGGALTVSGDPPFGRKIVSDNVGVYLQDFVELLPNLKLLVGSRVDFNDYSIEDRVTDEELEDQSQTRFSPRVGIVYQPIQTTSLYFNWANGFSPQFQARSRTEEAFEPQLTEQFELGIKQELLDKKLLATLAFFQISKQNVLTRDPADSNFSIQTGEQSSRGIELDIAGEILPGWQIIANYAYIDAEVTVDNLIPVGDRLYGVPKHSAGLWTTYKIQNGSLQGLGFGVGVYFVGQQDVSLPNTFRVPSYVRADAAIFYRRNNYRLAVNFKNISNVKYYEIDGYNLNPASPFTLLGTASVEF